MNGNWNDRRVYNKIKSMMRWWLSCLGVLLVMCPAAYGASGPVIGIGDQQPEVFENPYFIQTKLKRMRFIVPYDAVLRKETERIDAYLRTAHKRKYEVLVAFNHSNRKPKSAPSVKRYRQAVKAFRKRYPWIKHFQAWNEPNHCSQPLCRKPELAARYFNELAKLCRKCTLVAGDVLDTSNMARWMKRYRKALRVKPKIWGLHNYSGGQRKNPTATKQFLRLVKGRVWVTETAGLVRFLSWEYDEQRAARVARWLLKLGQKYRKRIKRIYFYHFMPAHPEARWDSGFLNYQGEPRPAYQVLMDYLRRNRKR